MFDEDSDRTDPACGDGCHVFAARTRSEPLRHVVAMSGDLDVSSRACAFDVCTDAAHVDVVVDLSHLEFMDCAGHGALIASRDILERRGGSLIVTDVHGAPLRLLRLLEHAPPDRESALRWLVGALPTAAADPS